MPPENEYASVSSHRNKFSSFCAAVKSEKAKLCSVVGHATSKRLYNYGREIVEEFHLINEGQDYVSQISAALPQQSSFYLESM